MRSPPAGNPLHLTRPAARLRPLIAVLSLAAAACAGGGVPEMPAAKAPPDGALRVRLSFGGAADLDLYVTGPRQETVYFGNTPSQMGGTLLEDLRCDTRPPRSEVVIFERPPPGRYRVGVDFPARCGLTGRAVPFRIRVESEQLSIDETGHIRLGEFQPNVLEFER